MSPLYAFALGYVAAMFDGEGHIHKNGSGEVEVSEKDIADALVDVMAKLGIVSRVRHNVRTLKNGRATNRYRVYVSKKQAEVFGLFLQSVRKKERIFGQRGP